MAITSFLRNDVLRGKTNVITWDGYGYYVYLPATFIYGDIEAYAFVEGHFNDYEISSDVYQLMETEDGAKFPIYNVGLAVWWAPAFLVTHALVAATGLAPPDGMSFPYQLMVVLMSLLTIFLGFRFLRKFLLAYCSELVTAITLLAIGLGTNLFYYVVEKPDMTHGYLFAGYAAFLWFFHRSLNDESRQRRWLIICGLIAGMLCLTRSSEIVVFAIPALHGLKDWASLKTNFHRTLGIFTLAIAVFSLQLLFYKLGTGQWFQDGYKGLGFDWLAPHLYEGFFSYRRGWLLYTPIMIFGLLGLGWLRRGWLLPLLVFTVANCYLLFSWHIWWYGNTFGSRPVVQSYAVLALPLGALIAWLLGAAAGAKEGTDEQGSRSADASSGLAQPAKSSSAVSAIRTITLTLLFTAFIALNLFQHWQYNQRIIPLDFTNKTYYWHVFGKTELNKKDRVFLDTNEKLPAGIHDQSPLLSIDTLITVPPKASREFTNLLEYQISRELTPAAYWVRASTQFSYHGTSYDKWKFPSIVTEHRRGGETLKWVQVNIPRTVDTPAGDSLTFDVSLPDLQAGDVVKQYVWNLSGDSLAVTQYQAQLIEVGK